MPTFISQAIAIIRNANRSSVFRRTFVTLLAFGLVPLLTITISYYYYISSVIYGELDRNFVTRIHNSHYLLSQILEDKTSDVLSWSKMDIPRICLDYDRPEAMQVFIDDLMHYYKLYSHIIVYKVDGSVFSSNSKLSREESGNFQLFKGDNEKVSRLVREIGNVKYIVITAPILNDNHNIDGYLAAAINWQSLENIISGGELNVLQAPEITREDSFKELYFYNNTNPINAEAALLKDHAIINEALNSPGEPLTYYESDELYMMSCIASGDILISNFVQCLRVKLSDVSASIVFIRNLAIFIIVLLLAVVCLISLKITEKVLSPFKNIMSILEGYRKRHDVLNVDSVRKKYNSNIDLLVDDIVSLVDLLIISEKKISESAHYVALGESTAMVAHDVRKPLASMKALLNSLPAIKNDPVQIEKMIANVDRNISHTNAMLNDILEFSKDAASLDLKELNPQSIISSALSDAFRNHPKIKVSVDYDLKHASALAVDGPRITRVLTNVIENALDAMTPKDVEEAKGSLIVKTLEDALNKTITLTVMDTGPGIPPDIVNKIFDPFFTFGKKGGTGLGLAICQKIISLHGGEISAANRTGATGAEIRINLPTGRDKTSINESELIRHSDELKLFREEEKRQIEHGDTSNTAEFMRLHRERGRGAKILIVDDDALFRGSVRHLLSQIEQVRDHVEVIEAESAETALGLYKDKEFDYVIADIDLGTGHMNGYELTKKLLKEFPKTSVLIHSNKRRTEMDKEVREIKSPRFMGFRPKPMTNSELLQFLACKTFEVTGEAVAEAIPKKKILILNDDDTLLISFKYTLETPQIKIIPATSVDEAIKKLGDHDIAMILSDINLGKGEPSGYDFLKHVKEKHSSIPFYFVSGYSAEQEEPKAMKHGANGYFQLPLDAERIKELLG